MPDMLNQEQWITAALLLFASFAIVAIDTQIGVFYFGMTLLYWISIGSRRFAEVEIIARGQDILKAFAAALVVLAAWVGISMYIWQISGGIVSFGFTPEHFAAFFKQLSLFTQTPILQADPTVRFVLFAIAVPIIESTFFLSFVLKDFWARLLGIQVRWYSINDPRFLKMLWVCILVGVTGSLFHITARLLNDTAMLIDVLFFMLSSLLVFLSMSRVPLVGGSSRSNMASAVGFHILVNSAVLLSSGG